MVAHADDPRAGILLPMMRARRCDVFARRPARVAWPDRLAMQAALARAFVAFGVHRRFLLVLGRVMALPAPRLVTGRLGKRGESLQKMWDR